MGKTFIPVCYLSAGALIAYFYAYKPKILLVLKKYSIALIVVLLIIVALQTLEIIPPSKLSIFLSFIFIPIIVIQFIYGFNNKGAAVFLENKLVVHIGKISYGIYVYHLFAIYPALVIKHYLNLNFLNDPVIMQIFKIVLTILIASISWKYFEKKINNLKHHFEYSRDN